MPGPQELLVIAVIALLVFGPDRLPEVARTAAKWITKLRSETSRNVEELKRLSEIQQLQAELKSLKHDLDGARSDVQRGVREVTGLVNDGDTAAAGRTSAARRETHAPTIAPRAADDSPPFDPEAT